MSRASGIDTELSAISELWMLGFIRSCGLKETAQRTSIYGAAGIFVMHNEVALQFARLHIFLTHAHRCGWTQKYCMHTSPTHKDLHTQKHTQSFAESALLTIFTS